MKKEIKDYMKKINNKKLNKEEKEELLVNIKFFQHERLVHLLVTMFTGLFAIISLFAFIIIENVFIGVLFLLFLILLVFYIFHYYFLENSVQKFYKIYNKK